MAESEMAVPADAGAPQTAAIPTPPDPTGPAAGDAGNPADTVPAGTDSAGTADEHAAPPVDPDAPLSAIDDLLARNLTKARDHPYWMGPVPTLAIAVVLCMDARVDAHAAFGITPGEVHLMRNAGGVVTDDVIRSLAISQHALGTREVMVVHHTDCGLARLEEDTFRDRLASYAGYRPTWAVQAFKDPHDSVRESLRRIRDSVFLIHTHAVRGFVFDVKSGLLDEVFTD